MRLTFHMNKRLDRSGTLWEGRFKSVLVEDHERALLTIAAYIDLNPSGPGSSRIRRTTAGAVMPRPSRAGGEASGRATASAGCWAKPSTIRNIRRTGGAPRRDTGCFSIRKAARWRRIPKAGNGDVADSRKPRSRRWSSGMERCPCPRPCDNRVRYFSDGAVLGSAEFVNAVFARERDQGRAIRRKAHERGTADARGGLGGLRVLRDLRKDVIGT